MTVIDEVSVHSRNKVIAGWYTHVFPSVAAYVQRNGGNLEEAKEIFQEAIVCYYEKLTFFNFNPESSEEAYLVGVAKKQWLKYSSNRKRHEHLSDFDMVDEKEQKPVTNKLLEHLRFAGEKCMDVLQAFYYEKLNMVELANRFGYTSERSATVQKYKCLEKVRDQVKHKLLSYEDFLN